jgi:hypothetical protein
MKKLFLFFTFFVFALVLNAQDSTLKQYTGKYVFADGSPVPEVEVLLADSTLTMGSSAGNSLLIKLGVDSFQIVEFSGTAVFKRGEDKQVNAVHIEAMGYILDGQKQKSGLWINTAYYRPINREIFFRKSS